MSAKIIGFHKGIMNSNIAVDKMKNGIFINSCKKLSDRTGVPFKEYYTKRQCSKFFNGQGIVYSETIKNK